MTFGFEFRLPEFIYYAGGFKDEEEARSNLEKISETHCKTYGLAIGTVYNLEDGKLYVLEKYEIELKNGNVIMKDLN